MSYRVLQIISAFLADDDAGIPDDELMQRVRGVVDPPATTKELGFALALIGTALDFEDPYVVDVPIGTTRH